MKIKRMQVLPILVVGGIAASCYGVINYINSSKSSFAAERRAIISANVEGMPDSITPNTITPTLKIGVSVSERVSSGDRVEFCTYGFGSINYGNVSLSSGEVIGTISAIGSKVKYRRNIQGDLSDNTSNRLELDKGGNDLCYAIQFNQNAEKYDNISGVQIASSAYVLFPMSSQDYTYRMRVVDGEDTEVYGKDVVVKATPYVSPQENQALVISSYYLRNENGQISGRSIPSIYMKTGTSLPVGSTIKYQLGQGGLEYYNLFTEGSIISFDRNKNRVYAEYDTINNNDIYVLKDLGAKRFKVVSHTASEIVLETMDVIEGGIHYNYSDGLTGRELKIQLVDPSKLSEGSNRLNPIETNSVVIDGLTSAEILNQKREGSYDYTGQTISPAEASLRRGTVLAKYVDEAGREISNQKTVSNNQPFGTQYNDTEIQITGYTFSRLGAGSAPKQGTVNGSTQTITYVYTQQRGTVLAKYVDEAGREISNQKTVSNNQPFGTQYTVANPDKIPGYRYVGLAPNSAPQNGTVNGGTQTIIFKFEKIQVTPKTQTIKVGETPDPKVHIPNFDQDFAGCKVEYKEPVDSSAPGVVDVKLIISCPGQENREVDSKVYVVGGNDISIPVGKIPNPKDHITDFDEKFPGCEVRYKNKVDTTKVGTIDATIIISCPGEDEKEVDVKIHVTPVPTVPQTIKVGETPDPKLHIPNFEEHFPGCDARYKTQPDTSKAGRIDVIIVVTCDDREIEIHSHLIIEELPAQVKAPNTGSASGILPAAIATISAIVSATAIFFKKK